MAHSIPNFCAYWDNGRLARCSRTGVATVYTPGTAATRKMRVVPTSRRLSDSLLISVIPS